MGNGEGSGEGRGRRERRGFERWIAAGLSCMHMKLSACRLALPASCVRDENRACVIGQQLALMVKCGG